MSDIFLIARLPARICPLDRGDIYEDPLAHELADTGLAEVTGGGTMMDADGDIRFVDLELRITGALAPALDVIVAGLDRIGAPKGTQIIDDDGQTLRTCGTRALVGVALDGISLAPEIYDSATADDVIEEMLDALGPGHAYAGHHRMATHTVVYFQGKDRDAMETAIIGRMPRVPLCQNAEVRGVV
jgi:hypothetical protein